MAAPLNVFSIPAGAPFLTVLAAAILDGRLASIPDLRRDPLALAGVTVFLPTRRAVRAFRETLVRHLGGDAAILPVIRPIGDADEEDHLLDPGVETGADRLVLPAAIGRLPRQLALAELTLAWGKAVRRDLLGLAPGETLMIPASAADAARLAADLARLMDDMETAGVPWADLGKLAPEEHAAYFQVTIDFLKIAFEAWPALLAERGLVDPVVRRDTLIRAEAERLLRNPPAGPVIAAGSTGSIPATAELLKAIASLPNGALVLPGLDRDLDPRAWAAIGDTGAASIGHPQFGLKQLLGHLGIERDNVTPLGDVEPPLAYRARLAAEALRPAETTDAWTALRHDWIEPRALEASLAGVAYLVAHNEREETLAIAIAIREALETPEATVALVTPDRTLARRVATELGRWGLAIDDSAPVRLDLSREGVFARLLAEAVAEPAEPARLLALLKHPFAAFGLDPQDCRRGARILELAVFRGRRGHGGIRRLVASLAEARAETETEGARVPFARKRLRADEWGLAARLAASIEAILGPLDTVARAGGTIAAADAARLTLAALAAAATGRGGESTGLFDGPGGDALATLLTGIVEEDRLLIAPAEWPSLLATLMSGAALNRPPGADRRVHIWGTLEARLQSADLIILGGLDEKVWPAEARADPWLSRAMRGEIGLPPPERRLGQAAHDFAIAFASPRVMLTRAEKRGGAPTVASRWLQRLFALAGEDAERHVRTRGSVYVELARDLDRAAGEPTPLPRPSPKPPVDRRPRSLSITEIEKLVRDPYEIYARHILGLEPLEPLGMVPDYALKGTLVHDAIGSFGETFAGPYNAAALDRLLALGTEALATIADFPDTHALWRFRFEAMARWIVEWESRRDGGIAERHAEIRGRLELPAPAGPFTLRGRADRIDLRRDGRIEILDFKTGTPPSARQVLLGFAPQLALEAAMVRAGAFGEAFAGKSIARLFWVALNAVERGQPIKSAVEEGYTADGVADVALDRLLALIAAFDDPGRGYASRARPMFETRYESPYDHLARVREWALVQSEEELAWFGPPGPDHRRRDEEGAGRRLEPARLGLGLGECRLGQDPCPRLSRHPPAPRRGRPRPHPLPDLHPGGGGGDGQARLRHPREMDGDVGRQARRGDPGDRTAEARRRPACRRAKAVRPGTRNPRRAEDPDHPRLLRAPPPPVSLRGQRRRAFRGPRTARRRGARRARPEARPRPRRRRRRRPRQGPPRCPGCSERLHGRARHEGVHRGPRPAPPLAGALRQPRRRAPRPPGPLRPRRPRGPRQAPCRDRRRLAARRGLCHARRNALRERQLEGRGGCRPPAPRPQRRDRTRRNSRLPRFLDQGRRRPPGGKRPLHQGGEDGVARPRRNARRGARPARGADRAHPRRRVLRRHRRDRPARRRGHRRLRTDEGRPRRPRFRGPRRQDRGAVRPARRLALGALQARPRPRPHPRRRGAGHEPAPVAGGQGARRGVLRRRGRERPRPHPLCRRRREAVDLLLPGRGAGVVRPDAARARRPGAARRPRLEGAGAAPLVPLGAGGARRGRRRLHPGEGAPRPLVRAGADDPHRRPAGDARPRRRLADDRAARARRAGGLGEPGRSPRREEPGGTARQPHRRHRRRLAPARGAARIDRAADPRRRHPRPVADARRPDRCDQPRAEDQARADRRCRPHQAHRAHRGDGPHRARPRDAPPRGRPVAGGDPQEPAGRPRRGPALHARQRPRPGDAVVAARSGGDQRRRRLRRGARTAAGLAGPGRPGRPLRVLRRHPRSRRRSGAVPQRLGAEAEDVLDEFLAQALAFEETNAPSLEGFLAWFEAADTNVRRDTDSVRDEVRVMTVHGAKGLEAPIVFLVDNGSQPVHPNHDAKVVALADDRTGEPSPLVWARSARATPAMVRERIEALRGDAEDEYRRLLYVAITRACDRLYVCGTEKQVGDRDRNKRWHPMISAALAPEWVEGVDGLGLPYFEWRPPGGIVPRARGKQEAMAFAPPQPAWLATPAPPAPAAVRRITPSAALAKPGAPAPARIPPALAGPEAMHAAERGRLVHRLLQSLPDIAGPDRRARADHFLAALAPHLPAPERDALVDGIMAVLSHPDFAAVFAPGSRAEVEVAGRIGAATLSGRIDRLAVSETRVLIVDYKTNRPAPASVGDTPHEYVMQLALYRAVLGRLYPGKPVAAAILWTDRPALMEIPSVLLDLAEMEAGASLA